MSEIAQHRNLRDLAFEIAALTTLLDFLEAKKEQLRDQFQEIANEMGADASKAVMDGKEIAKISLVTPKPKPYITDDRAFFNYVKIFHPSEVIESVRDSYKKLFLDQIEPHQDGAFDPITGELFDFIEFKQGKPYISTRFQPDGRSSIIAKFQSHELPLSIEDQA
jgi:hypothetical protein